MTTDKHMQMPKPSDVLPHQPPMLLLDKIESWGDEYLEAVVEHKERSIFSNDDGSTPAWVGIEYMAQAISALAGAQALKKQDPIRIGLLLGTRSYKSSMPAFPRDFAVKIRVDEIFRDDHNLVMFNCVISADGDQIAQAKLKAIQPDSIETIINAE